MCDENNRKDVKEVPDNTNKDIDVQGYAYCDSNQAKCLNDCYSNSSPVLTNIN